MVRASFTVLLKPWVAAAFNVAVSAPATSAKVAQPEMVTTPAAHKLINILFFIIA